MTDFGRKSGLGDMLKSVYDPNADGVIAVAQTQADMTKAVYDPALADIITLLEAHNERHENGGDDEIDCSGLDGVPVAPLLVDGTAGRTLRQFHFNSLPGTDPNTLKINTVSGFNHTAISVVDNIGKSATTGGFTLSADGTYLTIEAENFEANVLMAHGHVYKVTALNTAVYASCLAAGNGIRIALADPATDDFQDWTAFIVGGQFQLVILYVTA